MKAVVKNQPKKKELIVKELPKQKKKHQKAIRKNALGSSPYFQSLLAPWKVQGVKIPDAITTPSFCIQQEQRLSLSQIVDATGNDVVGVAIILGSEGTMKDYYQITASSGGTWTWTAQPSWASSSDISAVASALRVVSAGCTITGDFSQNANGGRFITAFVPGGAAGGSNIYYNGSAWVFTQTATSSNLLKLPFISTIPANKGFAEIRYIPTDPLSLTYTSPAAVPYRSNNSPLYGAFLLLCEGLTKGAAANFEVTFYQNLECLPLSSQTSLSEPRASLSDPIEMAVVSNAVALQPEFPVLQSTNDTLVGSAENWIPQSLRAPSTMSLGKPSRALSTNQSLAAPLVGAIGYGLGKSGALDDVPILGTILKTFGGMN